MHSAGSRNSTPTLGSSKQPRKARGIVLEITFDEASEPAVVCPLADFFGDGCNGKSMYFSTPLIECAPWSYNCYFPVPFAKRALVVLRNDTPQDAMNYSYVEWEPVQSVDQRRLTMLHPNLEAADLDKLLQSARLDVRLPNTFDNGQLVQTPEQWGQRRQEILRFWNSVGVRPEASP